jgi:hypothetical protein
MGKLQDAMSVVEYPLEDKPRCAAARDIQEEISALKKQALAKK